MFRHSVWKEDGQISQQIRDPPLEQTKHQRVFTWTLVEPFLFLAGGDDICLCDLYTGADDQGVMPPLSSWHSPPWYGIGMAGRMAHFSEG